jgi:hypothetical protein
MNNEQQEALEKLLEWRNGIHSAIAEGNIKAQDGAIWWSMIGIRNTMDAVAVSFGMGSFQDLDADTLV